MSLRRLVRLLVLTAACADDDDGGAGSIVDGEPPITGACAADLGHGDAFADCIDALEPGPGAAFGHDALPGIVLGPPVVTTPGVGSFDVAALGCDGRITLAFDPPGIVDGPGDDLLVFENAFDVGDETFAEPAAVMVSDDGELWYGWRCEPSGDGSWPAPGCAGVTPTLATDAALAVDPSRAGGDAFDLGELGLDHARFVRLVDRTREHYGDDTWCAGEGGGFDLDAVAAVPR